MRYKKKNRRKPVRDQFDIHLQAERLIVDLEIESDCPNQAEVHEILMGCGSEASSRVRIVRWQNSLGKIVGNIDGINKCLIPACPFCNGEQVETEQERLYARFHELKQSGQMKNTTTYFGMFTCGHRRGDSIAGLVALLKGAHKKFHMMPGVSQAIAGGFFAIECTTGVGKGFGTHPHIQFVYTFHGTDEKEHQRLLDLMESVFRSYIEAHSLEVLGSKRGVFWRWDWVSCEGEGDAGFYGKNSPDWNLFQEITNGFAKDDGLCTALTPDEYAEFFLTMKGTRWFGACGFWKCDTPEPEERHLEVVATFTPEQWNQMPHEVKRTLRTVAIDTKHWSAEDVAEYAKLAVQQPHGKLMGSGVHARFFKDFLRIKGFIVGGFSSPSGQAPETRASSPT